MAAPTSSEILEIRLAAGIAVFARWRAKLEPADDDSALQLMWERHGGNPYLCGADILESEADPDDHRETEFLDRGRLNTQNRYRAYLEKAAHLRKIAPLYWSSKDPTKPSSPPPILEPWRIV